MNIDILASKIQLEDDRVLLLSFENPRNQELKEIIFDDGIGTHMGIHLKTEQDFETCLATTIRDKRNGLRHPFIILDKVNDRVAGSTRYGNLNYASEKCEIGLPRRAKVFSASNASRACRHFHVGISAEEGPEFGYLSIPKEEWKSLDQERFTEFL